LAGLCPAVDLNAKRRCLPVVVKFSSPPSPPSVGCSPNAIYQALAHRPAHRGPWRKRGEIEPRATQLKLIPSAPKPGKTSPKPGRCVGGFAFRSAAGFFPGWPSPFPSFCWGPWGPARPSLDPLSRLPGWGSMRHPEMQVNRGGPRGGDQSLAQLLRPQAKRRASGRAAREQLTISSRLLPFLRLALSFGSGLTFGLAHIRRFPVPSARQFPPPRPAIHARFQLTQPEAMSGFRRARSAFGFCQSWAWKQERHGQRQPLP